MCDAWKERFRRQIIDDTSDFISRQLRGKRGPRVPDRGFRAPKPRRAGDHKPPEKPPTVTTGAADPNDEWWEQFYSWLEQESLRQNGGVPSYDKDAVLGMQGLDVEPENDGIDLDTWANEGGANA